MGEAKRREAQGLAPRKQKQNKTKDISPRLFPWLPFTRNQSQKFMAVTTQGAWIGIGFLILFWITIRFIGPAFGWWNLSDNP